MSRAHLAAIAALVPAGIDRYDTSADRPDYNPTNWASTWNATQKAAWTLPDRYVVLTAPNMRRQALTLDDVPRDVRDYLRVTAVGVTASQARWVQEQIFAAFDRKKVTLTGFGGTLRHSTADVFAKDDSITPFRYYAVDTYKYRATKAPIPTPEEP